MDFSITNIFRWLPIEAPTINSVFLPREFTTICYLLIIIVIVLSVLFFVSRKKYTFVNAIKRAILIAFFISGLFYAVHSDIGWTKWIRTDYQQFISKGTEEKLLTLDGPLYDFSMYIKNLISENYTIFSSFSREDYPVARIEYFLLPLKNKPESNFILILGDKEAVFNPETGTLIKGNVIIKDLALVFKYSDDAYLLTKKDILK